MNKRIVLNMLGKMLLTESALLILPLICSLVYKETAAISILITIGIALLIGLPLCIFCKPKSNVFFAKEGLVIVALSWVLLSLIGCLPFYLSREIPSFADAFFETVSGFTTTGSTILNDIESMSKSLLFWRSFTHWIGGMGVLVFIMAILPTSNDRSMHIARAEMPGPIIGKLVPKLKDTAKLLYLIYIVLTILEIILLLFGDMSLFESLIHSFGTAGTGGFSSKADSIGGYSPYIQWVISIFMFIFGINFNIFYLFLIRKFKSAFKSEELWYYFGIVAVAILIIAANIYPLYNNLSDALRHSAFQVTSISSTTGYSTADFDLWPSLSKAILLCLMLIGACAGSTAGGLKVSRLILVLKSARANFKKVIHPRSINSVKLDGKSVEDDIVCGTINYLSIYILCFFMIFLIVSFSPFDLETNISATAACFNNVGPGFAAVGPMANFAAYSGFQKIILSIAMLLGRLEIYPMLLILTPSTWFKK